MPAHRKIAMAIFANRRRGMTFLLMGTVLLVALLVLSPVARAHADLARSQPAPGSILEQPPDRVTIWFTEPVEPIFSQVKVLDAQGKQVDNGDSARYQDDLAAISVTLEDLPRGTYTVVWRNISQVDGHPFSGSFVFSVGVPSLSAAPPPPAASVPDQPPIGSPGEVVLRWLMLLSIVALVGALGFEALISQPTLAAEANNRSLLLVGRQLDSRTLRFSWLATLVLLLASFGELAARTAVAYGIPLHQTPGNLILSFVRQTGWGEVWLWRLSLLLGMLAVLTMASLNRSRYRATGQREWQLVALVFSAGVLLTLSLVSHSAAVTGMRTPAVFSDYLHLLAAGFWIGGLAYLGLIAPPVMKSLAQREKGDPAGASFRHGARAAFGMMCPESHLMAINRFSNMAMLSVGALIITGLYSAWAQVTVVPALVTPYGTVLLIKLGLIVPLFLLGAFNLLRVKPRLARDSRAVQRLHTAIMGEMALAVLVLLSVGALTSLEPARQTVSRRMAQQGTTQSFHEAVDNFQITLQLTPARVGSNRAELFFQDDAGLPARVSQVSLLFMNPAAGLGGLPSAAVPAGQGKYVVENVPLSVAGDWRVEILVIGPDAFDTGVSFAFELSPQGSGVPAVILPSRHAAYLFWGTELLFLGLLFGGVGIYTGGRRTRAGLVGIAGSSAIILAGVVIIILSAAA